MNKADNLYIEYSEQSKQIPRINPKDSDEEKERKRSLKDAIWAEYDEKIAELDSKKVSAVLDKCAKKFFSDLRKDSDAIGWNWNLSNKCREHPVCKASAGRHKKRERLNFPGWDGCTCNLTSAYI